MAQQYNSPSDRQPFEGDPSTWPVSSASAVTLGLNYPGVKFGEPPLRQLRHCDFFTDQPLTDCAGRSSNQASAQKPLVTRHGIREERTGRIRPQSARALEPPDPDQPPLLLARINMRIFLNCRRHVA